MGSISVRGCFTPSSGITETKFGELVGANQLKVGDSKF
jgi:hypothetical protein